MGYGYIGEYYTYEEAMDKSLEIASEIQKTFTSWDDFVKSYFYGYLYWSGEDKEDTGSQASTRWKVYEELKAEENSIYNLDWNLKFVKDWK